MWYQFHKWLILQRCWALYSFLIIIAKESCVKMDFFTISHKYLIGLMSKCGGHTIHWKFQECSSNQFYRLESSDMKHYLVGIIPHFWGTWSPWMGINGHEEGQCRGHQLMTCLGGCHINTPYTIMKPYSACMMPCSQLESIDTWGLHHIWILQSAWNKWNHE